MFKFLRSNIEKHKIHHSSTTRDFSIFAAHSARIGPILSCISPSQMSGVNPHVYRHTCSEFVQLNFARFRKACARHDSYAKRAALVHVHDFPLIVCVGLPISNHYYRQYQCASTGFHVSIML